MAGQCWFVYHDWIPAFEALSPAELGRLTMCALKYSAHGEEPELLGSERYTWPLIKSQIDRDKARYDEIVQKRSAAGKKSHSKSYQVISNDNTSYQEKEKEKEKEKENKKENEKREVKRFAPPDLDAVRAYCQERGNAVDPIRFIDYYTANGWHVGKNPMKDWKAAVRTWERNGFAPASPPAKKKQFTAQADYIPPKPKLTVAEINALVDKI